MSNWNEKYVLLYNYHLYSDTPMNRKPTKLEKKIADMTVRCFLEDRGIKEKVKQ